MILAHTAYESPRDTMPVVILHGLLGASRNWASVARQVAPQRPVWCFDLRNHGASPWGEPMDYPTLAADVAETLDQLNLDRVILIGHSMGGKTAMVLALQAPDRIARLGVVDIAPVAYHRGDDAVADETHETEIMALRDLPLDRLDRRPDADAWLADRVPDRVMRGFLLQNLSIKHGRLRLDIPIDIIERHHHEVGAWPESVDGATYEGPTLFVRGARSRYMLPEHAEAIGVLFPDAEIATIAEAGHWPHAERAADFMDAIDPLISD